MKMILTENVKSLGTVGDIVNVRPGFARNFLIPNRLGLIADESNKKQIADHQKRLSKKLAEQKQLAEDLAKKLSTVTITIPKRIGSNGRLFGTVTSQEVSLKLAEQGLDVERRQISAVAPIKTPGEHEMAAKLFRDVETTFKVVVEMDAKQVEENKKKEEEAKARKEAKAKADAAAAAEEAAKEKEAEGQEVTEATEE